jgi:tricorn protease
VPQPAGRCNDTDPMWVGDRLYFRSDRDGELNLYAFDRATKAVTRLSSHADFPVVSASAGGGRIAYEQAGFVHLLDPATGASTRLRLGVAADLVERRPRWAKGVKWIRGASLSPSGQRVALEFRGEIVTLPREKGDDRNLTRSPGVHERSPAWSPDGKWIAWFSDEGGEYGLVLAPQDGKGAARRIPLRGAGSYANPRWSPDSKKLSFSDNSRTIHVLDVATGAQTTVASDRLYGPVPVLHHAWSPDSRFLAYTQNTPTYFNRLFLYSVAGGKSYPVSDGLADTTSPVFDASGKYLYFLVSTDAGPVNDWFSQSNADMRAMRQVYVAVLAKGVPSPLAKESDEEKGKEEEKPAADATAGREARDATKDEKKAVEVTFDPDGLEQRILALPVKAGVYADLAPGPAGQIFYRRAASTDRDADAAVYRYDLEKRKEDTLLEKADGFALSFDAKRALVRVKDDWHLVDVATSWTSRSSSSTSGGSRDPRAEWAQIFDEAWRINRDYFYDPGFHGADWPAMRRSTRPSSAPLAVPPAT